MSTRANIHFNYATGETAANIYRHGGGYPESVLPDLDRFFGEVEAQAPDETRFDDASYLAAKFVVWEAGQNAERAAVNYLTGETGPVKPLNFRSVGIMSKDAGDAEFVYEVTEAPQRGRRPGVTCREAG